MNPPGKSLALAGTVLQVGSLISLLGVVEAVQRVYARISSPGGVDARSLASELGPVLLPIALGQALALLGAIFLLYALFVSRYRAPWFRTTLWVLAILWLLTPPIGTLLGLFVIVHLVLHEREFETR